MDDSIHEFLTNAEFVRWVKNPDEELEAYWRNWMKANPDKIKDIKLARELLSGIHFESVAPDDFLKQEVLAGILNEKNKTVHLHRIDWSESVDRKTIWFRLNQLQRITAIMIIGFLIAIFASPSYVRLEGGEEEIAVLWMSKKTMPGEKLNFTLPDETVVWLNAGSELEFPGNFAEDERLVRLKGEGFFEVHPDKSRPFRVMTDELVTTVLGTSFNIKEDTKKDKINISLLTGKIKVENRNSSESLQLVPGQQLTYDKEKNQTNMEDFDWKDAAGWKEGWIYFKNANLQEVVRTLENWYGVTIDIHNRPGRPWNYSGEYQKQNLENVLKSISYIEEFQYTIQGKKVTIKF